MTNHVELIQYLIDKFQLKSYLEIGVESGNCFDAIRCEHKIGIDPAWGTPAIHWTSNEFFNRNKEKFDIIFIDGWHHAEQMEIDVHNALAVLNPNGFIICHDCNPVDEKMQIIPRQQKIWTGNVWKGWVKLRQLPFISMFVLDMDYGCGVIRRGHQGTIFIENPTWNDFVENRREWLNLKEPEYIYSIK